jgi:thiamine kinase-like enzyme
LDRGKSVLSPYTQREVETEDVRAALARVPSFGDAKLGNVGAERLNGALTNHSYKVTTDDGVYVLRLAGEGTCDYVDRPAERHNARVAAAAGVNAEVLYFDAKAGTMLTRFVEGAPMDGEKELRRDPGALSRAVRALGRVHRLGLVFRSRFDVFARDDRYLDLLFEMGMPPPEGYHELERETEAIRRALEASPVTLAPCHNDPWPGNLLDTGERVYVIDWEYSGMNDPVWDLADLSVEAGLELEQEWAMLEVYRGGPVPPALYSRLELYKAMSDLHWALWGFVQHANGNPAEDFRAYALERLERCKRRVGSPDFGRHLGVVLMGRDGPRSTGRAHRSAQSRKPRSTEMRDFQNAPPYATNLAS